jgi:haloacetate dehalogenase
MPWSERFPGGSGTRDVDRRDVLRSVTALIAGTVTASLGRGQAQTDANPIRFFPGFKPFRVDGAGAEINGVIGGQGPPLLLLHGAPQTHVSWYLVAPQLAAAYTVVAADLRGYGDSSKPSDGDNHVNYSKRATALDQIEVMRHFGFERFCVVGHDRGARVAHRMTLDHPDRITQLAVIDVIPMYYVYTHVTLEIIQAYYSWFSNARPAPIPENELRVSYEAQKARATSEIQREYLRTASDPANIHAMCEDYRAAASIDLKHDEADLRKKVACPVLALWGEKSRNTQPHDVLSLWRERAADVTGKAMPSGHTVQVEVPDMFVAELRAFLKA